MSPQLIMATNFSLIWKQGVKQVVRRYEVKLSEAYMLNTLNESLLKSVYNTVQALYL